MASTSDVGIHFSLLGPAGSKPPPDRAVTLEVQTGAEQALMEKFAHGTINALEVASMSTRGMGVVQDVLIPAGPLPWAPVAGIGFISREKTDSTVEVGWHFSLGGPAGSSPPPDQEIVWEVMKGQEQALGEKWFQLWCLQLSAVSQATQVAGVSADVTIKAGGPLPFAPVGNIGFISRAHTAVP